jgi:quercetin dioxygenase-like cupin family protein
VNGHLPSFEAFRAEHLAQGFDEVLVRGWAAGQVVPEHTHPFAVRALVVQGSLVLGCRDGERTLTPGERFELAADEPHTERYGPEGATYWVARRNPPPAA